MPKNLISWFLYIGERNPTIAPTLGIICFICHLPTVCFLNNPWWYDTITLAKIKKSLKIPKNSEFVHRRRTDNTMVKIVMLNLPLKLRRRGRYVR